MRGYFSVFCHSRLRNLLKNYKVDCRSVLETESESVCVCVCVCACVQRVGSWEPW